jgi:hypothetical protein
MPSKDEVTRHAADLCANVLIDLAPDAPAEAEGGLQPTSTPSEPGRVGSSGWESLPVAPDWSGRPELPAPSLMQISGADRRLG